MSLPYKGHATALNPITCLELEFHVHCGISTSKAVCEKTQIAKGYLNIFFFSQTVGSHVKLTTTA